MDYVITLVGKRLLQMPGMLWFILKVSEYVCVLEEMSEQYKSLEPAASRDPTST